MLLLIFSGLATLVASVLGVEKEGDDPLQWLRDSIPGEPGVDYPIFSAVEQTSFSCDGKVFGGKPKCLKIDQESSIKQSENS